MSKLLRHVIFGIEFAVNIILFVLCVQLQNDMKLEHNFMLSNWNVRFARSISSSLVIMQICIVTWVFVMLNHYIVGLQFVKMIACNDTIPITILFVMSLASCFGMLNVLYFIIFKIPLRSNSTPLVLVSMITVILVIFLIKAIFVGFFMILPPFLISLREKKKNK